jgi:hypothetical protein
VVRLDLQSVYSQARRSEGVATYGSIESEKDTIDDKKCSISI